MKRQSKRPRRRPDRQLGRFERLESRVPLAADIITGLVHHWTFDETSGDIAADSAGDSDGTLVNWSPTEAKWEPGRVGGALRFASGDNYVLAPQQAAGGSYSVSFWLNVAERNANHPRILEARAGNTIYIDNESNHGVSFSAAGANNTFSPDPPTYNTWEHYAINFNAATSQGVVYRSGAPVAIGTFIDTQSLQNWIIGHTDDLSNHNWSLQGALDDLRVYNRPLTDDDIAQLASLGTPEPVHQEPVHHWTFDETTGFTAFDTAGGANGVLLNWNQVEPRWEDAKIGGGLRFSTADNAVVTPSIATGAQWTNAFWLKLEARSGINPRILEPWAYIFQEGNQGVGFTSRNIDTFDPTPPALEKWEHYAITYDTILDVGTIYRNGVAVRSGYFGDNAPASPWVFGHQSGDLGNHGDSLDGVLDDFRHYDRLLEPNEIVALASLGDPEPPDTGLAHYWPFDETTGTVAEDIVAGNDGVLRNWGATESKWVTGRIGGAVSFNDSDDFILTELPIMQDQYTFAFWLNQIGEGGFNPRIINPSDEDRILICQFGGNGVCISSNDNIDDPNLPTRNTWEHYAVTIDRIAGKGEIYRNGVEVAAGNLAMPLPVKQWVMGHSGTLDYHFDTLHGLLDEMRIYDRVLTDSEVQRLAASEFLVAATDAYSTDEDLALSVPALQGVLKNDMNLNSGTNLTVEVEPLHGDLELGADGRFTYDPDLNYSGADSFVYRLADNQGSFVLGTVALTVQPVNDAPSFTKGPDLDVADEIPPHAEPLNISFDGLSHHIGQGDPFTSYIENGFEVTPITGRWLIITTSSPAPGVHGNPGPSIWEDTYTASLEITRSAGGLFTFTSIDLFGGQNTYTLLGLRGGQAVFSTKGVLPLAGSSGFITIRSPSDKPIDKLRLSLERTNAESTHLDNIRLGPGYAFPGWAENTSPASEPALDEATQSLAFTVVTDQPDLFLVRPAINADGTLTFTPAPNVQGTATVTVTLTDSGGTANDGIDASVPTTFSIFIKKAHPWHNAALAEDVTADGNVVPGDALTIINFINAFDFQTVPDDAPIGDTFYDTTGDNNVTPDDALKVINFINAQPSAGTVTPSATFVGVNTTTQGNWIGTYGAHGYELAAGPADMPSYALISHGANQIWEPTTTDRRALQKPGAADRLASAWIDNYDDFTIDVQLSDDRMHRVAVYLLDWDGEGGRSERIEIMDAGNNQVLDTQLSGPFNDGKYLIWMLRGHVQIRITPLSGNAVVSGIIYD